jgi:hypothetical protein
MFYNEFFRTLAVLEVIRLPEMSNEWTLEQKEVNTPTFDIKQSSSNLQVESLN